MRVKLINLSPEEQATTNLEIGDEGTITGYFENFHRMKGYYVKFDKEVKSKDDNNLCHDGSYMVWEEQVERIEIVL